MTPQREECIKFLEGWYEALPDTIHRILDIGLAGDPKPGGNFKYFREKQYETLDIDPQYEPTYVGDVTSWETAAQLDKRFDLVIFSNTIEHVWDFKAALCNIGSMVKRGGYVIVDCPWQYPYHAEDAFDDFWRISYTAMKRLLEEVGLDPIATKQGVYTTSALARRPK